MILPPSLTFLGRELIALSLLEKKKGRFIDLRFVLLLFLSFLVFFKIASDSLGRKVMLF